MKRGRRSARRPLLSSCPCDCALFAHPLQFFTQCRPGTGLSCPEGTWRSIDGVLDMPASETMKMSTPTIQWSQAAAGSGAAKLSAHGATKIHTASRRLTHSCHSSMRPIADNATMKTITLRTQAFHAAALTASTGAPGWPADTPLPYCRIQGEKKNQIARSRFAQSCQRLVRFGLYLA